MLICPNENFEKIVHNNNKTTSPSPTSLQLTEKKPMKKHVHRWLTATQNPMS